MPAGHQDALPLDALDLTECPAVEVVSLPSKLQQVAPLGERLLRSDVFPCRLRLRVNTVCILYR